MSSKVCRERVTEPNWLRGSYDNKLRDNRYEINYCVDLRRLSDDANILKHNLMVAI